MPLPWCCLHCAVVDNSQQHGRHLVHACSRTVPLCDVATDIHLGLQGLGPHTKAATGIINTGVIGAALLTPIMGIVVDATSVIVALCLMFVYYAYIIWFCNFGSKIGISK